MGECTWLYGEWPNLGVGVVVWGVAKSCGGWVWLYGEWPNLVVGWVWLYGEWPNLGVGGCGCMARSEY